MILKILKSIILGPADGATTDGGSTATGKVKNKPVDLVHEAIRKDAGQFNGLVNSGLSSVARVKLKERIKRKVKKSIMRELDSEEVVEEVTEKILDAAEFDPMYSEVFRDDSE